MHRAVCGAGAPASAGSSGKARALLSQRSPAGCLDWRASPLWLAAGAMPWPSEVGHTARLITNECYTAIDSGWWNMWGAAEQAVCPSRPCNRQQARPSMAGRGIAESAQPARLPSVWSLRKGHSLPLRVGLPSQCSPVPKYGAC